MTEINFRSDLKVTLIDSMGSDQTIVRAARASTGNDLAHIKRLDGLIGYLMRENHTSPFEHAVISVRAEAPIFVAREWMRHRTQSYSELSMRFAEASPEFFVPPGHRPIVNDGSGAHPKLVMGTPEQYSLMRFEHNKTYDACWQSYRRMLDGGIAEEVARNVLPVGTHTVFWATGNLNNWFKFLYLRNGEHGAPQWEIVQVAQQVEAFIAEKFPVAYAQWREKYAAE